VGDLQRVDEIYRTHYENEFCLPSLHHTIGSGIISNGDVITAFGMVRLYPEAIIIIDKSLDLQTKVNSLELLYEQAVKVCKHNNFSELNAHTIDSKYSNLLTKRLGFKAIKGNLLQVGIKDG